MESTAQLVLKVPLEKLTELSNEVADKPVISSTCVVFTHKEMIRLLASGVSIENTIAGFHALIASRITSMTKRLSIRPEMIIPGGITKNIGIVRAREQELGIGITVPLHFNPKLIGVLGAALFVRDLMEKGKC